MKGHRQLNILECRAIQKEVESSTNEKHIKLASDMRNFDKAFDNFCEVWKVDNVSRQELYKVGLWEAKVVFRDFKSKSPTPEGWNRNLQSYVQKAIMNSSES